MGPPQIQPSPCSLAPPQPSWGVTSLEKKRESKFPQVPCSASSEIAQSIVESIPQLAGGDPSEMAEKIGVFNEYEKNKEPMMKVMEKHREALKGIDREKLPKGLENILDEAEKVWDNVIERGKEYGFRNAQATVLAPTGTIGFSFRIPRNPAYTTVVLNVA